MKNYKRYAVLTAVCFVAFLCVSIILVSCGKKDDGDDGDNGNNNNGSQQTAEKSFGVFLGVNEINVSQMSAYDLIVIDADGSATDIGKEQIAALQAKGTKVYSYLNIGTIEDFRDYYDDFKNFTLGAYDDWPGEYWMNVSVDEWQNFVVGTLAAHLVEEKGIDGFFLDNFDVYYEFGENINANAAHLLDGLITILQGLKNNYALPLMINGGDSAVTEILARSDGAALIDAVNQESVFTNIDFDKEDGDPNQFGVQDDDEREYYQEYIAECKEHGLEVYLLEYGSKVAESVIRDFCTEKEYHYYVSKDLNLTTPQYGVAGS